MRACKFILLPVLLLLALSCQEELRPDLSGSSDIVLRLNSSTAIRMDTKATDLQEGLRFDNVLVILTDNTGKVVGRVKKSYPYVPGVDDIQTAAGASPEEDVIKFEGLLPGNYTAYAYANYDAEDWQDDTVTDEEYTVAVNDEHFDTNYLDRELLSLSGTAVPKEPAASPASSSMLLTGKLDIALGLTPAERTLYLTRPVVRFKVTVNNHTPYSVTVDELSFSHFNPDRAYLIDHSSNGVPGIPSGVVYRALPAYDTSSPETVTSNNESCVYSTLLYENASPNAYKVFATLKLNRYAVDPSLNDLELSLGERAFGPIDHETLEAMDENESVRVLVINPRENTRSGRIYYGIGDTGLAWESCGYNTTSYSYNDLFARANAIYEQVASHTYAGFTYTGPANNKSGLAGWTGNALDSPSQSNVFCYTGARSTYFRTLTKTGGYYSIDGLKIDQTSGSSINNLLIVPGKVVSGKVPKNTPASYLVRFVNGSNQNQNLKSDCSWSASTVATAKVSKLVWDTGNNQDHQFILFGKYCTGGLLNRMLKENHKSVPLTYMSRNEEVNVIINVYYADQAGELDFVVDNSDWYVSPTAVSHIFE